jgi:cytochrome c oxidase assembly protein subunit 15
VAGLAPWVTWVAAATFLGTIGQAPLGLLTIRSGLHPLMVATHFLLALAVLAGGVVVAVEARRVEDGPRELLVPRRVRRFALFVAAAALALVLTGTLATASGPHPGDKSEVHRLGNLYDAVQVHVRVTAIFGIALLLLVSYLFRRRRELRDVFGISVLLLAVVLVQMAVGETQWRTRLPWGLVLLHVSLAAAIWGLTVLLVYLLWRPAQGWAQDRTRLSE